MTEICECRQCIKKRNEAKENGAALEFSIVTLCEICGNERCPHGMDDRMECTGGSEPAPVNHGYAGNHSLEPIMNSTASTGQGDEAIRSGIVAVTDRLRDMLLQKNDLYGNSSEPLRIFSKAKTDPVEQMNIRIDDRLALLMRGEASGEDVEWELMSCLILKRVAIRMAAAQGQLH